MSIEPVFKINAPIVLGQRGKSAYQHYASTTTDNPVLTEAQWITATNAAKTAAETAATNADNSATAAAGSAATATTKASEANTSAANASNSAATATTKASEASQSATNAGNSETAAAGSATTATTKSGEAGVSATNAANSAITATTKAGEAETAATNASNSETAAAGSAAAATTKAGEAGVSATNAANSAITATTKSGEAEAAATNANNSETAAAGSATNSANSATAAGISAAQAATDAAAVGGTVPGALAQRVTDIETNAVLKVGGEVQADTSFGGKLEAAGNDLATPNQVVTRALGDTRYAPLSAPNLFYNGLGQRGDNSGFSAWDYEPTNKKSGAASFTKLVTTPVGLYSGDFIEVDPTRIYELSLWAMHGDRDGSNHDPLGRSYFGVRYFNRDFNYIDNYHWRQNTFSPVDTTLAQDLNVGDTEMYLVDATNWQDGTNKYHRNFVWWPYTDSSGYVWDNYTYTRNFYGSSTESTTAWESGAINGNIITLRNPYSGTPLPAGTAVRNTPSWGGLPYVVGFNLDVPNAWTRYNGYVGGIASSTDSNYKYFPPATRYVQFFALAGYGGITTPHRLSISNVSLREAINVTTSPDGLTRSIIGIDNSGALTATPI